MASLLAAASSGALLVRRTTRALDLRARDLFIPSRGDREAVFAALRGIR